MDAAPAWTRPCQALNDQLRKVRTGRANPMVLDSIMVDYYGVPRPSSRWPG